MTDEIISLLYEIDPEDLYISIRLIRGEVGPGYEGVDLGIAEKLILKAVNMITSIGEDELSNERKRIGDIGDTLEKVIIRKNQASLFSEPLSMDRVFNNIQKIARKEGRASQDVKLKIIVEMLNDSEPVEAKYIARSLAAKMRLGISTMTVIDSLSYIFNTDIDNAVEALSDLDLGEVGNGYVKEMISHRTKPLYGLIEILSKKKGCPIDPYIREQALMVVQEVRSSVSELREKIERAYNVHPDLALIARSMAIDGPERVIDISVKAGVPLRSMLGERSKSIEDILLKMGGTAAFEYKYDGLRIQAHISKKRDGVDVHLYSRQLEDITEQYPDVVDVLKKRFSGDDCIVEGECVPVDRETGSLLPFQVISRRRGRKFDLMKKVDEVPVQLVLFDCLMHNAEDKTLRPFMERRGILSVIFPQISEELELKGGLSLSKMKIINDIPQGEKFFEQALENGCEGIMAKSTSDTSFYQAGKRGWNWIKFKRDYRSELNDTLDLVVMGGYHGSGKRRGLYGALLMGVWNENDRRYETLCKLGTGFTDDILEDLLDRLEPYKINAPPLEYSARMEADVFFQPRVVLEVVGAEISHSPIHTAGWKPSVDDTGYALRFPRFTGRFRDDKGPDQATTVSEVERLYGLQNKRSI
ncbi:MAG: ATP-dependent DNA ligase [Thermoplasmata archaeon]|nr:ATP-dependent DNA ligase [Thermoplasmata archaeon]